jgi:hypothetical protein
MDNKLVAIVFLFLFFGLNQTLYAQKQSKPTLEIRMDAYKKIRDTALVRVQQLRNDTLIQELYGFQIPSCQVEYGIKMGKIKAFKRYYSVDVIIPHGRYTKIYPEGNWNRVFDHGELISTSFTDNNGDIVPTPSYANKMDDIYLINNKRRCKVQEKRYYNILY